MCSHLGLELPCTICCCYLSLDLYMCSSNSVGNLSWEHFLRTMSFEQRGVRWDIETDEMYSFVLFFVCGLLSLSAQYCHHSFVTSSFCSSVVCPRVTQVSSCFCWCWVSNMVALLCSQSSVIGMWTFQYWDCSIIFIDLLECSFQEAILACFIYCF